MKTPMLSFVALALIAAACTQTPQPAVTAAAPNVTDAPRQPAVPLPAADPVLLAAAQLDLRALGYAAGKSGDTNDPALEDAVKEFQKDFGLPQDGRLTEALVNRMALLRAELFKAAPIVRDATFIYDDGLIVHQALSLLIVPSAGLTSDAPANFLRPLRPGAQGTYQLGTRAKNGTFKPVTTISCRAGRLIQADVPMGALDVIAVDCHGAGSQAWRSLYSVSLGLVVRQEKNNGARDLVAVRPDTGDWPAAARVGLDWALTHALEGVPVQWSSTGVVPHFEIKSAGKLSGQDAGLSGKNAALSCRRFDMVKSGQAPMHYPGIACQKAAGGWFLPGTALQFAAPARQVAATARSLNPAAPK